LENAPLTAMQLNDSVAADHACFADSTDVFRIAAVSGGVLWQAQGGRKSPIWAVFP
jgi:hypothetical protein